MKKTIIETARVRLERFAETHDLTLKVIKRNPRYVTPEALYSATFVNCEVKDGHFLRAIYGEGATAYQATRDYAKRLSNQLLIVNSMETKQRREIHVPTLW
jgi:hypothetical protein